MPQRNNPDQLTLFPDLFFQSQKEEEKTDVSQANSTKKKKNKNTSKYQNFIEEHIPQQQEIIEENKVERETLDLFLPFTYEEILEEIGEKNLGFLIFKN